jgi:hypothetical protein
MKNIIFIILESFIFMYISKDKAVGVKVNTEKTKSCRIGLPHYREDS